MVALTSSSICLDGHWANIYGPGQHLPWQRNRRMKRGTIVRWYTFCSAIWSKQIIEFSTFRRHLMTSSVARGTLLRSTHPERHRNCFPMLLFYGKLRGGSHSFSWRRWSMLPSPVCLALILCIHRIGFSTWSRANAFCVCVDILMIEFICLSISTLMAHSHVINKFDSLTFTSTDWFSALSAGAFLFYKINKIRMEYFFGAVS